jgi:hypothetical protein
MDAPSVTDWITAGGTFIAAGAAIVAAGAAIVAARAAVRAANIADGAATTWRDALRNQRYDECVASAVELREAINRYISAVKGKRQSEVPQTYTAAWDCQTRFRSAFQVARRYRAQNLPDGPEPPQQIDEQLILLNPEVNPSETALDAIKGRIATIVGTILTRFA